MATGRSSAHEPLGVRERLGDGESAPGGLEIRSEDFASTARAEHRERSAAALPHEPAPSTLEPASSAVSREADPAESRDAARQMFDAKEVDYNPRRPFHVTVGALLAAGIGYGVYVWWQMQPHYAVNTAAVQSTPQTPPPALAGRNDAPPVPATQQTESTQPAAVVAAKASALPAPKAVAAAAGAQPSSAPPGKPVFRAAGANRISESTVRATAPSGSPGAPDRPPIAVTASSLQPDTRLEAAYDAYQRGELEHARAQYQRVLERDPGSRDALLGLAAIDLRSRNFETAELRYLKLLELNPRDTYAFAGLMALQGNVDPVQSESRIKTLIATQPEATHLYFTLGNQYAAQARWSEAEAAYFKAYSANPENPDYAFNVAVSLDRLRQAKPALEYYRKALVLAARQPAAFDRARAEARAMELER